MKTIVLTVLFLVGSVFSSAEESSISSDNTDRGLFSLIMEFAVSEGRLWARSIEHVDMDRMLELMETGLVTFHKADWYVIVDDE